MLTGALGATDQRCHVENMLSPLHSPLDLDFALDPAVDRSFDGGLGLVGNFDASRVWHLLGVGTPESWKTLVRVGEETTEWQDRKFVR
jgi:hypothetical protein